MIASGNLAFHFFRDQGMQQRAMAEAGFAFR
jgi:hypothetical protein